MSKYLAVIEHEGDSWGAFFPDLPGIGVVEKRGRRSSSSSARRSRSISRQCARRAIRSRRHRPSQRPWWTFRRRNVTGDCVRARATAAMDLGEVLKAHNTALPRAQARAPNYAVSACAGRSSIDEAAVCTVVRKMLATVPREVCHDRSRLREDCCYSRISQARGPWRAVRRRLPAGGEQRRRTNSKRHSGARGRAALRVGGQLREWGSCAEFEQ